jgi:hypothetical protein
MTNDVNDQVIEIVRGSVAYKHAIKSRDHENFADTDTQQWDSLTGNIYALLRRNGKKMVTQSELLSMAKSAAKQLLIQENKYKGGRSFT